MKTYIETRTAVRAEDSTESNVDPEVTEEKIKLASNPQLPVYFTEAEARSLGAFEETALSEEEIMASLTVDTDEPL